MRIIPSEISSNTKSNAERSVFTALTEISDDQSVALHSVHLPKHHKKRVGEIDFVVISSEMLLFIEVKGGRISVRDGNWYYGPPGDERGPKESPFAQANGGMHELDREIGALIGDLRTHGIPSGYLVITTDVDIPRATEFEPEQYLGSVAYDGGRGLRKGIQRATRFWLARNHWARTPISRKLRDQILAAIRPEFDRVPNLRSRLTDLDITFERLTNEQILRLDELESNPRLIWKGGAGTGKTFLAAEAARRKSAHGTVLFTCASATLAAHLGRVLADNAITVLPFERLDDVRGHTFDQLIVDEAQDLMTFESLSTLEELVSGGLGDGRWIFMLDQNNQVLSPTDFDPDAWTYVSTLGLVCGPMRRNCRNTTQIVTQVRAYTGADLGVASVGEGNPVTFADVADDHHEASSLDSYLSDLEGHDVSLRDITLISGHGNWAESSAQLSQRVSKIERFTNVVATERTKNRLTWSSVSDFKGHENRIICLIDFGPEYLDSRLDALYVSCTRARAQLWISCRPGTRRALANLSKSILAMRGHLQ